VTKKDTLPIGIIETSINSEYALIRKCPSCGSDIYYTGKSCRWNVKLGIRNNTVCNKCNTAKFKTGGKPWNVGIPMSDQAKQKNSQRKKGKTVHSDSYKQWLSKNSYFCQKGKDSTPVRRLLKRLNISYDDFLIRQVSLKEYRRVVWHITKQQPITILENYEHRGLAGQLGAYHLDHIISIKYGFDNNIPAEQIGHISNLQMLPWLENIKKSYK
jgi:hypothetical protein